MPREYGRGGDRTSPGSREARRVMDAHPDWHIGQVLAEVLKTTLYTRQALYCLIHYDKRTVARIPRDYVVPNEPPRREAVKRAARVVAAPQRPVRASVHGYHGRSRLSAGYTEL